MLKRHWYLYFFGECPVCGCDKSYKKRMFTKKPKDRKDRIVYLNDFETYDWCNV